MNQVRIALRGVGAYVRTSSSVVTHLLFPNAETGTPPDAEIGPDGFLRHADNTRATPHYAGLVVPSASSPDTYVKLLNGAVKLPGKTPPNFPSGASLPLLGAMTDDSRFTLKLLKDWDKPNTKIAAHIVFGGGSLAVEPPPTPPILFNIDGHHRANKLPIEDQPFSPGVVWTAEGPGPVQLEIGHIDGNGDFAGEFTIPVNPPSSESGYSACIYNFDNGLPTIDELTGPNKKIKCKGRHTDDDFKWIYALMERADHFATWPDWLDGEEFPAPWASCRHLQKLTTTRNGCVEILLLPVSTCFQTVVDM